MNRKNVVFICNSSKCTRAILSTKLILFRTRNSSPIKYGFFRCNSCNVETFWLHNNFLFANVANALIGSQVTKWMWAKTKFYNQIWADGGNELLGKSIKKYIQCDDVAIGFWLLNQNRFGIGIYALLQGESTKWERNYVYFFIQKWKKALQSQLNRNVQSSKYELYYCFHLSIRKRKMYAVTIS